MKISIGYDTKSIDKAIKQIEEYRKHLLRIIPKFIERCANKIIQLANDRLSAEGSALGLSGGIISEIQNGWELGSIEQSSNGAIAVLSNTADKAVYIEFGVGQVGSNDSHKEASKAGYEYDVNMHGNEGWRFWARQNEIDIGAAYRDKEIIHSDGSIEVYTKGQPATMFAFQALQDFKDNEMYIPIAEQLLKGL